MQKGVKFIPIFKSLVIGFYLKFLKNLLKRNLLKKQLFSIKIRQLHTHTFYITENPLHFLYKKRTALTKLLFMLCNF